MACPRVRWTHSGMKAVYDREAHVWVYYRWCSFQYVRMGSSRRFTNY